jgi:crotonobetainyl-CoA:carnitine CoA-transferase CaiB-like acyl-CoA transferase
MVAPLEGVRVLEVANWLAAPAAAALMADLGADVIKVEPPGGEVYRGFLLQSLGYTYEFATNYAFQLDNRGKRSVTVALERAGGPELVRRMAASVDIFITNLLPERCAKFGLTYDDVRGVNPHVVYTHLTGYGSHGPDAGRPGFDYAAFWARSGLMGLLGEPPSPPPLCRGGQGDHTTALNILAAVLAALRVRDRTGDAQRVEVTLQATGMWTLAGDLQAALLARQQPGRHNRTMPGNPIWNSYQCADGRWVLLVMPVPDPLYWPRFCQAVGRPEWARDERYDTLLKRRERTAELTPQIETIFREHELDYWSARLDEFGLIWAPVAELPDVIEDPQVRTMGWFTTIDHPEHGAFETLATPFHIDGADMGVRGPAPDAGQHTFDVLAALGIEGDELTGLMTAGVIG